MKEPWKSLLYLALIGSLPLAFWYALWPHRKKLNSNGPRKVKSPMDQSGPTIIESDGT